MIYLAKVWGSLIKKPQPSSLNSHSRYPGPPSSDFFLARRPRSWWDLGIQKCWQIYLLLLIEPSFPTRGWAALSGGHPGKPRTRTRATSAWRVREQPQVWPKAGQPLWLIFRIETTPRCPSWRRYVVFFSGWWVGVVMWLWHSSLPPQKDPRHRS